MKAMNMDEQFYTITPKLTAAMDQITAMILDGKAEDAAAHFAEIVGTSDPSKQLEFIAILSAIECGHHTPSEITVFVRGFVECHMQLVVARMHGIGPLT